MRNDSEIRRMLRRAVGLAAALAAAAPATAIASDVTIETVRVGASGNPSVGIVPFTDAAYASCAGVADCLEVGYQGNLSTVGQAQTRSPWGTLDQGGNAVEWTDTITPPPSGMSRPRVWRRLQGGVTNALAYQMWPSAVGLQPQDNAFFERPYPWLGLRVGVVGSGHVAR